MQTTTRFERAKTEVGSMAIDVQRLQDLIEELANQADAILAIPQQDLPKIRVDYQRWYSQVCQIVNAHLPTRASELEKLYYDAALELTWYLGIRSYLRSGDQGYRNNFEADVQQQKGILLAVPHVLKMRALEVAALVTADLVDGELNEAKLLLEHGFVRAAGALAGVALEAHLKLLHAQSNLAYSNKDTIVPLAVRLRQNNFITLGDEKKCIAMADTRNKCDHKKDDEPTRDLVEGLIEDVDRFTKRVQVV
jgi:hypothetical protein